MQKEIKTRLRVIAVMTINKPTLLVDEMTSNGGSGGCPSRANKWNMMDDDGKKGRMARMRYSTLRSACDLPQRSFGDVACARDGTGHSHEYEAARGRRFQGGLLQPQEWGDGWNGSWITCDLFT
jgi:hypothetical protein